MDPALAKLLHLRVHGVHGLEEVDDDEYLLLEYLRCLYSVRVEQVVLVFLVEFVQLLLDVAYLLIY